MPTVYRLGEREELWSEGILEALERAPRRFLIPEETELRITFERLGLSLTRLGRLELLEHDAIIVPLGPTEEIIVLVDRLLGPGGCPWDQAQTHNSLKRHLLEEAYEVLDAIDSGDSQHLEEEVGDLLLQPVMHGQIASDFSTQSAARRLVDKLIRRHPHVFGETKVADADEVLRNWDAIKKSEMGDTPKSLLAGVPTGMASLLRAHEISKRAARAGFEWPDVDAVWEKMREEEEELKSASTADEIESEIGDLLFTAVNVARWYGVEPEEALRKMLNRFTNRFQRMEAHSPKPLVELSPTEWDELWCEAKTSEF
ncbi:MAG: nucleoside triphosphate pyrophosphohydrolase [Fimbriimonadaceae bacterium]